MQLASSRVLVIVAPKTGFGQQLYLEAAKWHELGLIRDFFWIDASQETRESLKQFKLKFRTLSQDALHIEDDFLQFLGGVEVKHLDLVAPWFLGDLPPDQELALLSLEITKAISEVLPKSAQIGNVPNKRMYSTLLSVPSIESVGREFMPVPFGFDLFDQNVYISPESRATPWAGSAPVLAANGTVNFVLSQLCTVGGVWAGSSESLSAMLAVRNYQFTTGNILVMRSITTAVVANGVASQIVIEALSKVGDPEFELYANTDAADKQRPVAIPLADKPLREAYIKDLVDEIIASTDKSFLYVEREGFVKPNHKKKFRERMEFFWNFTKQTIKAFPMYSKNWLLNKRNKAADTLFGDVVEAVPESLDGYDEDLRKMLVDVERFNADVAIQDSMVITREASSQMPAVWRHLREKALSSLDGFGAKSEKKAQVLPTVDDVVRDPAEKFEIEPQFAEHLQLQESSIGFEQVAELRQKLSSDLSASNLRIDQLRERLIQLQRQREEEAEAQRIADEQAAEEAEAQRIADEQAAEEELDNESESESESEEEPEEEFEEEPEEEFDNESEEQLEEEPEEAAYEPEVLDQKVDSLSGLDDLDIEIPEFSNSDDKPAASNKRGKSNV
jgi:hypothetical protein